MSDAENLTYRDNAGKVAKHKPLAPKKYAGTRPDGRYINCSCGWQGRIMDLEGARAEHAAHARGEILDWEIDSAHFDAICEDRGRSKK